MNYVVHQISASETVYPRKKKSPALCKLLNIKHTIFYSFRLYKRVDGVFKIYFNRLSHRTFCIKMFTKTSDIVHLACSPLSFNA